MPFYKLRCHKCEDIEQVYMSIEEFILFSKNNNICKACGEGSLVRTFLSSSGIASNVSKDSAEIVEELKMEAKVIAEKIRAGDLDLEAEIYGDEVNKLKNFR
jgi:hypothetical protein